MADQEELEAQIERQRKRIEQAEADAERSRERLEELKRERRAAAGPDMEEFEAMSSMERRELKEEDPDTWRDLMDRKRQRGEEALQRTGHGALGA